jgi:O-methyltransferase involved in polyketide biosynthesis
MPEGYFERVARTAYGPAYARTFTDVPFSQEIFNELERLVQDQELKDELLESDMIPMFEARYLLTNQLLEREGSRRILEVAAGLSSRGLLMARGADLPCFCYVEVDQPKVVELKAKIFGAMAASLGPNRNRAGSFGWYLQAGDALKSSSLEGACVRFNKTGPIAVVNEGFMVYLSFKEKAIYAENVHRLLKGFRGVWITPDIMTKDAFSDMPAYQAIKERWHARIGRNLDDCHFADLSQAQEFYEDLGFSVEVHTLSEVMNGMVSPERLNIRRATVRKILDQRPLFVMRVR